MAKGIDEIIADVQEYLNDLRLKIEQGTQAIAILRDLKFGNFDGSPRYPGDPGGPVPEQLPIPAAPPEVARPVQTIRPKNKKTLKTRRTGKTPKSQFKGVSMLQGKWRAQYYNKQTKKNEHLGSFDNEYLAAAAWFERDGNKAEAARLRALVAEHKDLNPDNTTKSSRKKKVKWVCLRCGTEYRTDPNKSAIVPCGHNDGFREVPAES